MNENNPNQRKKHQQFAKQKQGGTPLEHQKLQQAEMAKLKREVSRLEEENASLKKVVTHFTKESK